MEFFELFSPTLWVYGVSAIICVIIVIYRMRQDREAAEIRDKIYRSEVKELIKKRKRLNMLI